MANCGQVLLITGSPCLTVTDGAKAWARARIWDAVSKIAPGGVIVSGPTDDFTDLLSRVLETRGGLRRVELRADGHRYNNGTIASRWREGAVAGHTALHVAMVRVVKDAIAAGWKPAITSVVAKWSKTYAADNVAESGRRLGLSAHVDHCPENMRRRKNGPEFPSVYFFQASTGHIKIGFSTKVTRRQRHLQVAQPESLTLLVSCPGSFAVESALHRRFAPSRTTGEWFRPTPDLLGLVARLRATRTRRPLTVNDLLEDQLLRAA